MTHAHRADTRKKPEDNYEFFINKEYRFFTIYVITRIARVHRKMTSEADQSPSPNITNKSTVEKKVDVKRIKTKFQAADCFLSFFFLLFLCP